MRLSIGQKVMVGFAVALLLIGIVVTTFYRSMSQLMSATQSISHTRQVIGALDKLSADLDSAETGQRSYLITGDESDLDPYHKALEKVRDNIAELRKLTADNRRQQESVDILEPQVAKEMTMLKETVDVRKTKGFQAAQQIVLANRKARPPDQVALLINEMKAQEREVVTQRGQAVRSSGRRATYVIISGSILALLVVPWAAFVIHREMARRKKAEAALEQHAAIQKSILDSMGDGVVVSDENGKFLLFNPAAQRILGMGATNTSPDEWTRQYGTYLPDRVTPYPADQLPLVRAMRGESVDSIEIYISHPQVPQGVWISVTARPLCGENGVLKGGVVVLRDVSASKQAEEALRSAKQEAERASRFKDQFLSTMSHELRTPLNAILGFSDLLPDQRYGTLNDRQRRYVNHIHTSGKHLLSLINDILDLSKIQAGRLELAFESVRVDAAFGEALDTLRPLADKKSQTLSRHAENDLNVRADAIRFKQVLMNLVGNAIKFTPEGGRIDLAACLADGKIRVEVRDTGPGIPAEEQKRIFESFYRLRHAEKSAEGTGLGLAITQRLVELHGGELGLESQPGHGSCFYFSLPTAPTIRERPVRDVSSRLGTTESPRILVIEDDPVAAQLIESRLSSSGYEVIVCDQPQLAAEIAAELRPNAITLDLLMKPINGWEVLVQLKRDPRSASIPVIVITIADQPALGAILGADEYLVKPVEKQALLAAMERCLGTRAVGAGRPILVVEDDEPAREIITELLTAHGHAVTTASDGAQARAQVEEALPELVILDLLLPKVSGFELLAEWRANPRTADLPVFVLTSKDLSHEEENYLRSHAEYFFHKQQPWQEALANHVRRVVGLRQMESA